MIKFAPKPEHHTSPQLDCQRCHAAEREGALAVHVLTVSEALEAAQRAGRVYGITRWRDRSRAERALSYTEWQSARLLPKAPYLTTDTIDFNFEEQTHGGR